MLIYIKGNNMSYSLIHAVPKSLGRKLQTVVLAVAVGPLAVNAFAQTATLETAASKSAHLTALSTANSSSTVALTKIIGMDVQGANGKKVGKIKDLIVNVSSADIRYAILEFDPGFLKAEKFFAVPLNSLQYVASGKPLMYKEVTRAQLEKTAVNKTDWEKALDNNRYVLGLDQSYGYKPPSGESRSMRASSLIGKNVVDRSNKKIGDIKDLVVDMKSSKVDFVVLAFDPSWMTREKMFAFRLTDFTSIPDKNDLLLDVNRETVETMKSFDAKHWENLNDLNREQFMNRPDASRE